MDRLRTFLTGQPPATSTSASGPHHRHHSHHHNESEYAPILDPDRGDRPSPSPSPDLTEEPPHRMVSSTLLPDGRTLYGGEDEEDEDSEDGEGGHNHDAPFNWGEYAVFALVGVAMLWAWNMFLAASPYFTHRLSSSPLLTRASQPAITSVSTVTNLLAVLVLAKMQYTASYPYRINIALVINVLVFALLALSTLLSFDGGGGGAATATAAGWYFAFLMACVAATAWAAGLMQNGAFAFAAGFGRQEYTQGIMMGQALAGVLPSATQMVSVVLVPASPTKSASLAERTVKFLARAFQPPPSQQYVYPRADSNSDGDGSGDGGGENPAKAPFFYFLTAVLISLLTLSLFHPYLVTRHDRLVADRADRDMAGSFHSVREAEMAARKVVGMGTLWRELRWLAMAVFMCFAVAMFFPVFTARIVSVSTAGGGGDEGVDGGSGSGSGGGGGGGGGGGSLIQNPSFFIPLSFFFWNLGDLIGRILTMFPSLTLPSLSSLVPFSLPAPHPLLSFHFLPSLPPRPSHSPKFLFVVSVLRIGFLPLYALCNLDGGGARVGSDLFYLLCVQLPFGMTNGWLGSTCMMRAGEWVEEGEREAAGGFMGLALVGGLTVGSLCSFAVVF